MIALVSAIFGFGELLEGSAKFMQTVAFISLVLSAVSFLLGLFEEDTSTLPVQPEEDGMEPVHSRGS
jgi:uncharacterized membrane protein YtjA (UPF0391 family)